MRVLIAGASGLVGSMLAPALRENGHEVRTLVRRPVKQADEFSWDPPSGALDGAALDGVEAVIDLCGAPLIGGRWSGARKQVLVDSRVEPTEVLAEAVRDQSIPLLVNASGVNFYGDHGSAEITEETGAGTGFLAGLCAAWEGATAPATDAGSRVVLLRTSPILAKGEGLLRLLGPLFSLGLGAKLGDGKQYFPWIGAFDAVAAIRFAVEHDRLSGPVNLASPNPVTNAEFTRALARWRRRPAPWRAPATALRLALGEAADDMMLASMRAVPAALSAAGFTFGFPDLDDALAEVR